MVDFLKSLFRYYQPKLVGPMLLASITASVPFVLALVGPLVLSSDLSWGMVVLLGGFLVTGQVLAISGRLLDTRFQGPKAPKVGLGQAWARGWVEGVFLSGILVGLFSLLFSSLPFYWSQGSVFGWFSMGTLILGTLLILGALPYYLPVRRREGTGILKSLRRSFQLMNRRPGLALIVAAISLLTALATVVTLGLFPGFGGLAALHQGAYETAVSEKNPKH